MTTKVQAEFLSTALISDHTQVSAASTDHVLIHDASDNTLKKALISTISSGATALDDIGTGDAASTLATSSGDIIIDSPDSIVLDADGDGSVSFKDGGTRYALIEKSSDSMVIRSDLSDGDIIFQGKDNTTTITALTLDMSSSGDAVFRRQITCREALYINTADNSATTGYLYDSSGDFIIRNFQQDKDLKFNGNDGGSIITALTIDMSEAGAATFNNNVTAFSDERLKSNIQTLESGLDKVNKLRGVTYTRDEKENIGVIAQEVEKILPEIVLTADDEMGTKSVDYGRLTAVLIEAVKELSAKVKELENK